MIKTNNRPRNQLILKSKKTPYRKVFSVDFAGDSNIFRPQIAPASDYCWESDNNFVAPNTFGSVLSGQKVNFYFIDSSKIDTINITLFPISNIDFLEIPKNITNLYIGRCNISIDLDFAKDFVSLEFLTIRETNISGNLSSVSEMTELRYIDGIKAFKIRGNLSYLEKLTKLESIRGFNNLEGNIACPYLPNLSVFTPFGSNFTSGLETLVNCPQLQQLDLVGSVDLVGDPSDLIGLNKLNILKIGSTQIRGDFAPLIADLEDSLVYLDISNLSVNLTLDKFENSTKIQNLYIQRNSNISGTFAVENLTQIKDLNLSHCGLSSIDLDNLVARIYNNGNVFTGTGKTLRIDNQAGGATLSGTPADSPSDDTGFGYANGIVDEFNWAVTV